MPELASLARQAQFLKTASVKAAVRMNTSFKISKTTSPPNVRAALRVSSGVKGRNVLPALRDSFGQIRADARDVLIRGSALLAQELDGSQRISQERREHMMRIISQRSLRAEMKSRMIRQQQ